MKYSKPQILAQNGKQGSYAAGCPSKDSGGPGTCTLCERAA